MTKEDVVKYISLNLISNIITKYNSYDFNGKFNMYGINFDCDLKYCNFSIKYLDKFFVSGFYFGSGFTGIGNTKVVDVENYYISDDFYNNISKIIILNKI